MRRRWSRAAEAHLAEIHAFIAQHDAAAATRTVRRIIAATRRLELFPYSAPQSPIEGTRELKVRRLPYVVVYAVVEREDAVEIHGVFHTSRHPDARRG